MVLIILHRINTIEGLKKIPHQYGVEIDIRGWGDKILLSHDPLEPEKNYDELEDFLKHFKHAFIVFNTKEAGYEAKIFELAKKYGVQDYFLLDVGFPYLYRATRVLGIRNIAVRYSEVEPIEAVESQVKDGRTLLDWVWVDTNTMLPLNVDIVNRLKSFKTCLVCPERWGRPQDIPSYIEQIKKLNFKFDAVMTGEAYVDQWEDSGVLK